MSISDTKPKTRSTFSSSHITLPFYVIDNIIFDLLLLQSCRSHSKSYFGAYYFSLKTKKKQNHMLLKYASINRNFIPEKKSLNPILESFFSGNEIRFNSLHNKSVCVRDSQLRMKLICMSKAVIIYSTLCNHLIRSIDEIIRRIVIPQKDHAAKSIASTCLKRKTTNFILTLGFRLVVSMLSGRRWPRLRCVTVTIKTVTFINRHNSVITAD